MRRSPVVAALAAAALVAFGGPALARAEPECPQPLALAGLPDAVRGELQAASAAAAESPDDADIIGRLGMLLHAYEQHRLAYACYEKARVLQPAARSWTYLSAVTAAAQGDSVRAASLLQGFLAGARDDVPARLTLADVLFQAGELVESRAAYERLTRDFPELALAHYGLGRTMSALGETEGAVEALDRAVAAAPQFGRAHYALALLHRAAGRVDRARDHLEAYSKHGSTGPTVHDPLLDDVRAMRGTARDLIAEGARLGNDGRLADAIALHLKALERDPLAAQAHVNLISLYGRAGRVGDAEAHYKAALSLAGSVAGAHYNYGVLLAATGRPAAALGAFRQALAVDPFHAQAHNNAAALLAGSGRPDQAASHYRLALSSDPRHRGARFGLARVLLALGRPGDAIPHLERLLHSEDTETPMHKYVLARALLAHGESARAAVYAREAFEGAVRLRQSDLAAAIERDLLRGGGAR